MQVEYTTTFADFKAAQTLYLRARPGAGLRFKLWMYGLPLLSILFTGLALHSMTTHPHRGEGALVGIAGYLVVLTILLVALRPWNLKRLYNKRRRITGVEKLTTATFDFDETMVRSGYPGRSEGQFHWQSIVDYAEDQAIFLLFISSKAFLYIPKRAMTEDQRQALRELLQSKGKTSAC